MKFTVEWASRYNGVCIYADDETVKLTSDDKQLQKVLFEIEDEASDNLPGYTHKKAKKWNGLEDKHIIKLRKKALKIIHKHFPDVKLEDVDYEEDPYSS